MDYSLMPEKGTEYALYKDKVVYKEYNEKPDKSEFGDNLLELHMFDKDKEYRYVKLSGNKVIEKVISDESEFGSEKELLDGQTKEQIQKKREELKYTEKIYVLEDKKVEVVNYISYDENDIMFINNYRLKEVE